MLNPFEFVAINFQTSSSLPEYKVLTNVDADKFKPLICISGLCKRVVCWMLVTVPPTVGGVTNGTAVEHGTVTALTTVVQLKLLIVSAKKSPPAL